MEIKVAATAVVVAAATEVAVVTVDTAVAAAVAVEAIAATFAASAICNCVARRRRLFEFIEYHCSMETTSRKPRG